MQVAVDALAQVKGSCKFAYGLAKNKKVLDDEVSSMREGLKPDKDFMDFENKRVALCAKYAEKGEDGQPKIVNNAYVGVLGNKEFEKEVEALNKESKAILDDRQKQLDSFNDMIKEEVELELWAIKLDEIPDDVTAEQLGPLQPIITE